MSVSEKASGDPRSVSPELQNNLMDKDKIIQEVLGSEEDSLCGIGPCRRTVLQTFANPVTYLVVSSIVALVQGLFFTYSNATLSTIEKIFGLPSKLSGLTTTGNDVSQLILSLPLSFFAGRSHRPRWLAFGMMLSALGCLIAVLPHFFYSSIDTSSYLKDALTTSLVKQEQNLNFDSGSCIHSFNATSDSCSSAEFPASKSYLGVVAVFLIAQMFAGVASLLYYTVGYSYLDESVAKEKTPLILSISGGMRLLGPVCGYSLASWALSKWVHPLQTSDIVINPSHPRWIGAWWVGYAVIGVVLTSISWILFLLPRTLPATRKRKEKELLRAAAENPEEFHRLVNSFRPAGPKKWSEMGHSLYKIMSNKVYCLVLLNQALFWFAFFGYITFKSKYLEHQFQLSAAEANRYIAVASLAAALTGWLGTGATLSYFRPKTKSVIIYMAILSAVSCSCHLVQLTISCDRSTVQGLENVIDYKVTELRNSTDCEEQCECRYQRFSPVCLLNDSQTFFNPCYARCQTPEDMQESGAATLALGLCSPGCTNFAVYLGISVVAKMAQAASRVPVNLMLLRSVEERDKDLGLGVFNAVLALASSIPAPILFGWAIDSSCTLWDSCNGKNLCWLYNVDSFRRIIHGFPAVFLALCFVTDLLLMRYHKNLVLYESREEKDASSAKMKKEAQTPPVNTSAA